VSVVTEHETWVGRAVPRLEDAALLHGEGAFMDDIDPVRNSAHAAILRSQLAHARIVRLDPSRALEHPGVVGVLTGADVAAMSSPFPVGVENAPPYLAAANEVARYAGEPLAVVVARDRYIAEDAAELIDVEYEPLDPVLDPEAGEVVHERSFSYGDPDAAFAAADLVVSGRFSFPRWTSCPLECYGVVADWNDASGVLTAWSNFQGPFTLHSVAAASLGLKGSKLRLITSPNSGGSFGIKSTVYVYIVLIGLASRKLGVPVRWTEDRLEHLAGSSASTCLLYTNPSPRDTR
jgi:2-furoyl-CoA dehydrogenase large subunit